MFTETVRAANHAINRLDPHVSIDLITGSTARRQRREILDDLRVRRLDAVAAPRVLDEGVDVPDANLGIVMSASRTRRQMIQRMGRILRRKQPGVSARFVIMFAKDTLEDPAYRVERDGFLDEIERISQANAVFDGARFDEIDVFLAEPGPLVVPEPERLERYERAAAAVGVIPEAGVDRAGVELLTDALGVERAYGLLCFAAAPGAVPSTPPRSKRWRSGCRGPPMRTPTCRPSSAGCRRSPSRESSPSGTRPGRSPSRSRESARTGGSVAPAAVRRRRSCPSAGRCSTRPCPARAPDELTARRAALPLGAAGQTAGATSVQVGGFA